MAHPRLKPPNARTVDTRDSHPHGSDVEVSELHSIEYDAIPENETFHAFALRFGNGPLCSFRTMVDYAQERAIPVVPILFEGTFLAVRDLRSFVSNAQKRGAVGAGRRAGGGGDTGGARVPRRGVQVQRLQERSGRARPIRRTLVEELEGMPHREPVRESTSGIPLRIRGNAGDVASDEADDTPRSLAEPDLVLAPRNFGEVPAGGRIDLQRMQGAPRNLYRTGLGYEAPQPGAGSHSRVLTAGAGRAGGSGSGAERGPVGAQGGDRR